MFTYFYQYYSIENGCKVGHLSRTNSSELMTDLVIVGFAVGKKAETMYSVLQLITVIISEEFCFNWCPTLVHFFVPLNIKIKK